MEISGSYTLYAPREQVWTALLDPHVLRQTIPGCEQLEASGADRYHLRLSVGIAAFKGTYDGTLQIFERAAPERYRLTVQGAGARGVLQGDGGITLEARGPSTTIVTYAGQMQLGGAVAGVGMRVSGGAARMLINQFFSRLAETLVGSPVPGAPTEQLHATAATVPAATVPAATTSAVASAYAEAWPFGLPEARPLESLESEQVPAALGHAESPLPVQAQAPVTSEPTPFLASSRPASASEANLLTQTIRRSGLSDGSVESERRISGRLLGALIGVGVVILAVLVALLVAHVRG
jgi:carbon monoxide dehydrogenase subunit G